MHPDCIEYCCGVLLYCPTLTKLLGCMQSRAVLVREALAKEGKLEATLQACAENAARRNTPFFVLPQGTAAASLTSQPLGLFAWGYVACTGGGCTETNTL